MKTPLSYYGGKQQLASTIVSLIPEHQVYCEPFIGGAAVFFAKPKSKSEIINDINAEIVNFYEVLQRDFSARFKRRLKLACTAARCMSMHRSFGKTRNFLGGSSGPGLSG